MVLPKLYYNILPSIPILYSVSRIIVPQVQAILCQDRKSLTSPWQKHRSSQLFGRTAGDA